MSLDGCESEQLSPHVTYMSAPCSDFPLAFLPSVARTSASLHLPHLGLQDPTCSPQALPRLLLHWGLPLRGPGTEGLAGWLAPRACCWSSGCAGSLEFYICQHLGATPSSRSVFSAALALPEALSNPTWEIQLISEVWSSESRSCCLLLPFYPRAAGGPGLGEVWCGEKTRSRWSGWLACSWREEAQVWAELWPPGFFLLHGFRQDTLLVRASPPQP